MVARINVQRTSGNLSGAVAGTVTPGATLEMGDNARPKVRYLSALVTVDAETNGLVLSGKWQCSSDQTNWFDAASGTQNAASVALATGTAGSDAPVTRLIPAPEAVHGWRYARFALVNGVQTGGSADTWTIGYCFRVFPPVGSAT
jgi:hypothetical protein